MILNYVAVTEYITISRQPPQLNYPPDTVPFPVSREWVRHNNSLGWYLTVDSGTPERVPSKSPTYAEQANRYINAKL